MRKELVLNELSVREAASLHLAREQMARLVDTLGTATRAGSSRFLRTHAPIDAMLLAPDYPVSRWRNDPAVEREKRSFLRSLISKSPLLSAEDDPEILDRTRESDVLFEGRAAFGLKAALLLEALSISILSETCWETSRLSVTYLSLGDNGEVMEDLADLPHASRAEHVAEHVDWLAGRDVPVAGGRDLWDRRNELFPSLTFCESVGIQLAGIDPGHPLLRQICRRLSELDSYFRSGSDTFDPSRISMKITPESGSTLQKYEAEHSFVCPDGIRRLFSWHGRLTPGAWRLYFLPEPQNRNVLIGYIGKKLPCVDDPT